jgi:hypothetical protein
MKKQLLALSTLILALALLQVNLAQTSQLTPTICFFAPEVHPELNQNFTVTISTYNITAPVEVAIVLTWNVTNLQLQAAQITSKGVNTTNITAPFNESNTLSALAFYSVGVENETLTQITFIANSTDPANLTLSAYFLYPNQPPIQPNACRYFVPYYAPFNSVQVPQ